MIVQSEGWLYRLSNHIVETKEETEQRGFEIVKDDN